jgi:hypothetical protein
MVQVFRMNVQNKEEQHGFFFVNKNSTLGAIVKNFPGEFKTRQILVNGTQYANVTALKSDRKLEEIMNSSTIRILVQCP